MNRLRVVNETRRTLLGTKVGLADTLLNRTRGFLFRAAPGGGEGLFLTPCKGVHMYGMRFPLDVIFIDYAGRVVAVHADLRPMSRTAVHKHAHSALELPAGTVAASGTRVGDQLSWSLAAAQQNGNGARTAPIRMAHKGART